MKLEMFFLTTLTIGLFFATCMVLVQPLFLFWPMPLILPFIGGAAITWILRRRGWFGVLSRRRAVLLRALALPGAFAVPYAILLSATYLSMPTIDLPRGSTLLHRTVDVGGFYMAFQTKGDFDAAKVHFRDTLGVTRWRDSPTLDPLDDPAALMGSSALDAVKDLRILIYDCTGATCAEVGWTHSTAALTYLIALSGAAVLFAMMVFGPPEQKAAG